MTWGKGFGGRLRPRFSAEKRPILASALRSRAEIHRVVACWRSRLVGVSLGLALSVAALLPSLRGAPARRVARLGPLLASWETIGGCGAGSSVGTGGIKWIGRNVSGGLLGVQVQANFTPAYDYQSHSSTGFGYVVLNQVGKDIGEKWRVGVIIPYVYKFMKNPVALGFDVSNRGLGDINALVTRRLGAINDTAVTLSIGFPTGTYDAGLSPGSPFHAGQTARRGHLQRYGSGRPHDRQHAGPERARRRAELSGWPERDPELPLAVRNGVRVRGLSAGPFVRAAGVSANRYRDHDRDATVPSGRPMTLAAVSSSIRMVQSVCAAAPGFSHPSTQNGFEPWTAGLGVSVAPF